MRANETERIQARIKEYVDIIGVEQVVIHEGPPKTYSVTIQGKTARLTKNEMTSPRRFSSAFFELLNGPLDTPRDGFTWRAVVNTWMKSAVKADEPTKEQGDGCDAR